MLFGFQSTVQVTRRSAGDLRTSTQWVV